MLTTLTTHRGGEIVAWRDEQTGREVRRFTGLPARMSMLYFRMPKVLPDHRVLLPLKIPDSHAIAALDFDGGFVEWWEMPGRYLRLREADGVFWTLAADRTIWQTTLPGGATTRVAQLPEGLPGQPFDITCDGRHVILAAYTEVGGRVIPPNTMDAPGLFAFFNRPRYGALHAYDLQTGALTTLVELPDMLPIHPDASPTDPLQLKYSHDRFDAHCQRMWTVRLDGSAPTPIRPQVWNELITHEFWWPDGQLIGYKYQDRRDDPTVMDLPWAEYSPIATQFGLADLAGHQVYLSDPLESYHSHIMASADGALLTGEGTHDHSFVHAARFDRASTKVDFVPHATIHTPCVPLGGQSVNAGLTGDNRWLIYNDTVDGDWCVCGVLVDV